VEGKKRKRRAGLLLSVEDPLTSLSGYEAVEKIAAREAMKETSLSCVNQMKTLLQGETMYEKSKRCNNCKVKRAFSRASGVQQHVATL
jgi:hypothetical protein